MLTTLRIKNLGLVPDLTLEFQPGFNVITGETGAGKSLLIGALNLVLGERADRSLIRSGAESCIVEAVFDTRDPAWPLSDFLAIHGLESSENHELLIKRSLTASGVNRQFINGSPTTLQALAEAGRHLADLHGPHDHQSLLSPACQLDLLDGFASLRAPREAFASLVRARRELLDGKAALIIDDRSYAQQLDLLRHQVREITAARLEPGEAETLESEHRRSSNASRLGELAQSSLQTLGGEEHSMIQASGILGRNLQELTRLDPAAQSMADVQDQIAGLMRELSADLSRYAEQIDLDPARLAEIEERMSLIQSLRRKYGSDIPAILAHRGQLAAQLDQLESRDVELEALRARLESNGRELLAAAEELRRARRAAIPKLSKAVSRQLGDLGFHKCHFDVAIDSAGQLPAEDAPLPFSGLDTVDFQFSPNPGEPPRPLRSIASSGEMARVMLAIKTVLATVDAVPVLVFDEVDANVGGETARMVGEKMREIGKRRQVLCITHLAPVAAAAAFHFQVSKEVKQGRTVAGVRRLDRKERVEELARMLGGFDEAVLRHAESLLA